MGIFSKNEESKEEKKQQKEKKKESSVIFFGEALQPIGKIPVSGLCGLSLKPEIRALMIKYNKIEVSLTYERIRGFKVENEVTLAKSGSGLGGAIIGGALFGGAGAIVGQNAQKGKTQAKWIGILTYEDKEGNIKNLGFTEYSITGPYSGATKSFAASSFESVVNKIASDVGEDITEL